jgi:hypothetical protein
VFTVISRQSAMTLDSKHVADVGIPGPTPVQP